jgi:ketosteroid isomerase-like protein
MEVTGMTDETGLRELERRWAAAELAADLDVLDAVTCPSFRLVGPAGFVLDKEQWLERYRSGQLTTTRLSLEDPQTHRHGDAAITIATQVMEATYAGHPAGGRFRATLVAVRDADGSWRYAGQHLSPIADRAASAGTGRS